MRKEADLELEATVPCTIELPQETSNKDALAIVQAEWAAWLAEEGRVDLTFGDAGDTARSWEIEDERFRISLDV